MIVAGYVGALVLLFVLAVPVAFALAGTSILVTLMERGIDFNPAFMVQKAVSGIDNFMLLSVPFFIYAGKVMNVGGITVRIYAFAKSLVGAVRGGLAQVNVIASIIFAGMTGTAVSEAAGLGTVVIKSMKEEGYDEEFAVAVVAASSTIGPIIPPSVPLVIYALMANVSVGGILIAGLIPGLLMGAALMAWIAIVAERRQLPRGAPFRFARVVASLREGFLPLLTPVILIGGILSGVFTPTEAAAIAALYATILAMVVYREVGWRELAEIMRSTAVDTGVVMLIVSMAMIYGYLVTRAGLTLAMVEGIAAISRDPIIVGLLIMGFLLIVGCFLEATAAIIILTPVLRADHAGELARPAPFRRHHRADHDDRPLDAAFRHGAVRAEPHLRRLAAPHRRGGDAVHHPAARGGAAVALLSRSRDRAAAPSDVSAPRNQPCPVRPPRRTSSRLKRRARGRRAAGLRARLVRAALHGDDPADPARRRARALARDRADLAARDGALRHRRGGVRRRLPRRSRGGRRDGSGGAPSRPHLRDAGDRGGDRRRLHLGDDRPVGGAV